MRIKILPLIIAVGLAAASCQPTSPTSIRVNGNGSDGEVTISAGGQYCAGRTALSAGAAEIENSCFTGEDNIVLCTDVTTANGVRCTPRSGALSIGGTGNDVIAYARMR